VAKRVPQLQVNVRLDEDLVRILEAAAFVEHSTVSELVRLAVEGVARQWATDEDVRLALEAREGRNRDLVQSLRNLSSRHDSADGQ
jgi:predicted transcriptional regulator